VARYQTQDGRHTTYCKHNTITTSGNLEILKWLFITLPKDEMLKIQCDHNCQIENAEAAYLMNSSKHF